MAGFNVYGLDEVNLSLAQIAELTPEQEWPILEAGAKVCQAAQQETLLSHYRTHQLHDSISIQQKTSGSKLIARVFPKGKRKGGFTGKRMKKDKNGKRRSSGHYEGTNAEVAYFLEYGTPRMDATHWMETTNEQSADAIHAAMEAAWDDHLKSLGL